MPILFVTLEPLIWLTMPQFEVDNNIHVLSKISKIKKEEHQEGQEYEQACNPQ